MTKKVEHTEVSPTYLVTDMEELLRYERSS